jgi:RHS repeat-associated protein
VAKTVGGVTRTFLYDGWAMIQETTGTQTNSYVYGLDLSGSMQDAGTIGGILSASLNGTQAFYFYDANGNVSDLADASGNSFAHYEWDPYGNATVRTGSLAVVNPFRFSTKYTDDETGLLYYGYRYYSPEMGRWGSRDPVGESGGVSLYQYVLNQAVRFVDILGMWPCMLGACPIEEAPIFTPRPPIWFPRPAPAPSPKPTPPTFGPSPGPILGPQPPPEQTPTPTPAPSPPSGSCPQPREPCEPCSPPARSKTNIQIHRSHDHGGCLRRTGSMVHWHYDGMNQNPRTCECFPAPHQFGGCGYPVT